MELLGLVAATFAYCLAGGVVPILNAEVYMLAAGARAPAEWAVPLVLAATAGQMVGKSLTYWLGRGTLVLPWPSVTRRIEQARATAARYERAEGAVTFVSAVVGIPPFYVISVAAGVVKMSFAKYLLLGTLGRLIHFAGLFYAPALFGRGWP